MIMKSYTHSKLSQNIITFDFETNKNADVIAWSICIFQARRNNYIFKYGVNITSFVEEVKKIVLSQKNKRYKSCLSFWGHNASNFDSQFILPELGNQKYFFKYNKNNKLIKGMEHIKSPYKEKQIKEWKKNKRLPYVSTIINSNNKILSLKIQFDKNKAAEIKDSNLFWKGSLKSYAFALGNEIKKEKQDWEIERKYDSVEKLKEDKEFFTYLKNDVLILNKFLQKQMISLKSKNKQFHIPQTQIGITGAQLAYEAFCRYIAYNKRIRKLIPVKVLEWEAYYDKKKKNKKDVFKINNKIYNPKNAGKIILNKYLFPIDWQNDLFKENKVKIEEELEDNLLSKIAKNIKQIKEKTTLKQSYIIGGLTTFNKNYVGLLINSASFDINSSYPNVLNGDYLIPYGEPSEVKNEEYNFGFYYIEVLKDLKNYGPINFLNDANLIKNTYPSILKSGSILRFGETMYKAFVKYYKPKKNDIKIQIVRSFKSIKSKEIFGEFIDYFYAKKVNAKNDVEKISAKLFLNSVYGKFITKQTRISKIFNPKWDNKLIQPESREDLNYERFPNVKSHYEKEKTTEKAKFFNPVGMSIVEQARVNLVSVKLDRKDFIYCDTDSIKLRAEAVEKFKEDNKEIIDDNKLGCFKDEKLYGKILVLEKKRYGLFDENNKLIKLVGSGFNVEEEYLYKKVGEEYIKVNYNDIAIWDLLSGKIWFKNLKRELKEKGVVLIDSYKQLTPIWENCDDTKWFSSKEDFIKNWKKMLKSAYNMV